MPNRKLSVEIFSQSIQFEKLSCDLCGVELSAVSDSYGIPVEIDEGHVDWLCDDCADQYLCHEITDGDDPNNWYGCGNHTVDSDTGLCRVCNP